jgi:predicted signal transduction protein with EAL and GGDEF domain
MRFAVDVDPAAAALDALPDPLLVFDADGRLILCNRALVTLAGAAASPGRPAAELLAELLPDAPEGAIAWVLRGERLDLSLPEAVGEAPSHALVATLVPLAAQNGRVGGGLALLRPRPGPWPGGERDEVTGLPTHGAVRGRLEQRLQAAGDALVALLCLDLSPFRRAFDILGYVDSDALRRALAARVAETAGDGDTLFQITTDEIAILQDGIDGFGPSVALARRLIERLREPFVIAGRVVHGAVNIGIALHPEDGRGLETLLQSAHLALERSRDDGPHSFQFFLPEMAERLRLREELQRDLAQALDRGEILLHYQPKVALASGEIETVEALVRWQHPERGLVPPGQFIPVAEDSGLILPLGRLVLTLACRQLRAWGAAGLPTVRVAVNLSAAQFVYPDLVLEVQRVLEETGAEPGRLVLEITESMLMRDVEMAGRCLTRLDELGIAVSLDDFGAGHSSLAYLKMFPLEELKIDRCFVQELADNALDAVIVQAIVTLGHALGLAVVAEGVETAAQLEAVRRLGCDRVQGFYLARPLPAEDCALLLEAGVQQRLREARSAVQRWPARPPAARDRRTDAPEPAGQQEQGRR